MGSLLCDGHSVEVFSPTRQLTGVGRLLPMITLTSVSWAGVVQWIQCSLALGVFAQAAS